MRALVTGGGGFLGSYVVRELLTRGHQVASYSRGRYPELDALGVPSFRGDLGDKAALRVAMEGVDTVFHVAAKAGVWGRESSYEATNVQGTQNVIDLAQELGVERLVYTSSPSVCFDGTDHLNAPQNLPYPTEYLAPYPRTKAVAERAVLAAHGSRTEGNRVLSTCALRPHLIFGPGDPHLIPRLIERAQSGRLVRVGDGTNRVSLTWVENAAHAHVDAAAALSPDAACGGQAYFISQKDPVRLWDWIGQLLRALDLPAPRRNLSSTSARRVGAFAEGLWRILPLKGEPPLTRFVASQLAASHTYDMGPAERDLGYHERTSMNEATRKLMNHLRHDPVRNLEGDQLKTPEATGTWRDV